MTFYLLLGVAFYDISMYNCPRNLRKILKSVILGRIVSLFSGQCFLILIVEVQIRECSKFLGKDIGSSSDLQRTKMKMNTIQPAQLVIYDRTGVIKTIHINQQQVTIGRNKPTSTCDILLSSELVSSVHGAFVFYNGEYYYIDDASNVNGTFINGKK